LNAFIELEKKIEMLDKNGKETDMWK